jgi:drug/metabolite transporter (DMT)-like permease
MVGSMERSFALSVKPMQILTAANRSRAAVLMAISVAAYAAYPVLAVYARGEINPLLFVGVAHITALIASVMILFVWGALDRQNYIARAAEVLKDRRACFWVAFGGTTNGISHAALFAAIYFAPPAVVTILYETWPIFGMYLFYFWMRSHYRSFLLSDYVFSFVAFIGLVIVITSSEETAADFTVGGDFAFGVALALLSSITMALSSGAGIRTTRFYEQNSPSLPASFMVQLVTKLFSGLVPLAIGLSLPASGPPTEFGLLLAFAAGVGVVTIGASFYLVANTIARSSSINILYYVTPVLSLMLLALLGLDFVGPSVALGAILIIASNLLIFGRADPSYAYTASLLTLMASSTYVYYFQGMDMAHFYDALAVPSAIFAILIAFMLDRVFQRTNSQEQLVIDMLRRFDADGGPAASRWVIDVWMAKSDAAVKRLLDEAQRQLDRTKMLDLYALGLKKMTIFSFGERFIVIVVAAMVVSLANIFRPNTDVANLMAPALSSAVVFLTFTIFDRLEARTSRSLQHGLVKVVSDRSLPEPEMTERPLFSSVLIALIFAAFIYVVIVK